MSEKYRIINGTKYELTFEDNFDGDELDMNKWEYCPEWVRGDFGAKWSPKMAEVKDGNLYLNTAYDDDGTVISGAIQTEHTFTQTYGYFETRAMLPKPDIGFWCAFWMMCGSVGKVDGSAVSGVELDVFESITNSHRTVQHNLHWDGYLKDHKSTGEQYRGEDMDLYNGWHTYAVEWTEDEYIFYIDDKESFRTSDPGICNQPGYMLLSIEYGSATGKTKISPEDVGPCFRVDWVRAYKKA